MQAVVHALVKRLGKLLPGTLRPLCRVLQPTAVTNKAFLWYVNHNEYLLVPARIYEGEKFG